MKANLESYRRRGATNRLAAPSVHAVSRTAVANAPVVAVPPPSPRIAPPLDPEADRIARLRRLAAAMGGTEEEVEAAIAEGSTPDQFALLLADGTAVDRMARRILEA